MNKKTVLKLAIILFVVMAMLCLSSIPAFAALPPPEEPPPEEPPPEEPPPSPSPNGGGGDVYGGYAGQLLLIMFGNHWGYKWVEDEGWRYGKTLAVEVVQIATYYNWGFRATYKLEIPQGTVITGYWGRKIFHLEFMIIGGEYYFSPPYLKFSKPVIIYKMVGDEWIEELKFNQIFKGKAILVDTEKGVEVSNK